MKKIDISILHPDGTTELLTDIPLPLLGGRAPDCEITLKDSAVSRYHFMIEEKDDSVFIRDMESKNGTFVNSENVKVKILKPGDLIKVGATTIEIKSIKGNFKELPQDIINNILQERDIQKSIKTVLSSLETSSSLLSALILFKGKNKNLSIKWRLSNEEAKTIVTQIETKRAIETDKNSSVIIPFEIEHQNYGGAYLRFEALETVNIAHLKILFSFILFKFIKKDTEETLEKEQLINKELSLFIPSNLTPEVLLHGIPVEPDEREVSILFCDIVHFTSICEKLNLREIADFLENYFKIISESVHKYSGWVNKFMGDGAMCIFGAPLPLEEHSIMAVKCGQEIISRIKDLRKYPYTDLNVRIGINSGKCIVGKIGKGSYSEYTVLGDTVNVASRLQEISNPGTILVGESTYQKIRDKVKTRYTGTLSLKGKKIKTRMYEVVI